MGDHYTSVLKGKPTYFKDEENDAQRGESLPRSCSELPEEPELILINLAQPSILLPT